MSESSKPVSWHSYAASRVTIGYALAATIWILTSDLILASLIPNRALMLRVGTIKGLLFVGATTLLLHVVLRRRRVIERGELASLGRRAADADRIAETLAGSGEHASQIDLLQAYNALAESEARLRMLVNAAAEAIITTDENGLVWTWNREAERIFRRSEEDAIGEELCSMIATERLRDDCRALFRLRSGAGSELVDTTGVRADGSEFPMEVSVIPVEWGERILNTAFIRDISDRVRAAREAQHVAAIVNASADAIFAVSADATILSWNPAAERTFRIGAESAKGTPLALLFPEDAGSTVTWLRDSIARGIPIEAAPLECARGDQERFRAFVTVSPLHEKNRPSGAALVVRDASEQWMTRDRVKDAEILASLGRLASATGHQFNNVLMGIQPFIDVLKRQPLPETAARAVEQIANSVQRGRRVTADIQSFTRASDAPVLRSLTTRTWLADLHGELESTLGPAVSLSVAVEHDVTLTADPQKLRQVFLNIAANARDAMPEGGSFGIVVRNSPTIPPHAAHGHTTWAEILMRDSSEGLDEESKRRIFEPLFAKKRGNSGLEMATVRQIVSSHGGSIEVSGEAGGGTELRILLPRVEAAPAEPTGPTPRMKVKKPTRVLLVEDDPNIAVGISQALIEHGMHVDVVHTGSGVMRALYAFSPEVVVLDIFLPDANGFDVYRSLAEVRPDLPVIFSTGHADQIDLDAVEPLRLPHVELLRKPYSTETLLEAMERVTQPREV